MWWDRNGKLSISHCTLYNSAPGHNRSLSKPTIVLVCRYWCHFLMAHKDPAKVLMFPARAKCCPPFSGSCGRSQKLPLLSQPFCWHQEESWAHGWVFVPSRDFTHTSPVCPYGKYWTIQLIKEEIFRNRKWNKSRFWPVVIFFIFFITELVWFGHWMGLVWALNWFGLSTRTEHFEGVRHPLVSRGAVPSTSSGLAECCYGRVLFTLLWAIISWAPCERTSSPHPLSCRIKSVFSQALSEWKQRPCTTSNNNHSCICWGWGNYGGFLTLFSAGKILHQTKKKLYIYIYSYFVWFLQIE